MSAIVTQGHGPTPRLQRQIVRVLALGQILGGLGTGASLTLGALLVTDVSGSSAWSGMAATMGTLGAAVLAVPLARLAQSRGRRVSLSTGAWIAVAGGLLVIAAAFPANVPLLLAGLLLMGSASALNLQARFAATDLAGEDTRGRDLSMVVWSTTIGAVIGPNLFDPGESIGHVLGLPPFTGGFAIAVVAQLFGAVVYLVGLRPDPLLTAISAQPPVAAPAHPPHGQANAGGFRLLRSSPSARRAVLTLALSHATMVALMSMTPVHLTGHGSSITLVGLTISLHVAGMYALSPVFGTLTDRLGGRAVVLAGQAMFIASLLISLLGAGNPTMVTVSLILLGLGWSASTVAASAMVSAAVEPVQRARLQGVSDSLMNLAGAAGGAAAGLIFVLIGFNGLSALLLALVAPVIFTQLRSAPSAISAR